MYTTMLAPASASASTWSSEERQAAADMTKPTYGAMWHSVHMPDKRSRFNACKNLPSRQAQLRLPCTVSTAQDPSRTLSLWKTS